MQDGYVCMKAQSGNQTGTALTDALGAPSCHHPLRSIFVAEQGGMPRPSNHRAATAIRSSSACPLSRPLPQSRPDPSPCQTLIVSYDLPRAAVIAGSFPLLLSVSRPVPSSSPLLSTSLSCSSPLALFSPQCPAQRRKGANERQRQKGVGS
ncbi:hypothetical protein LZ31DRAFT_239882 [Colletotrichum somersetense]|nr:hypothetical protein LZ31DRAFT_239882 [Colletotrichum somersetense]